MNRLRTFFGAQSAEVLTRFRGRGRLANKIRTLDRQISALRGQLESLKNGCAADVATRSKRVAESESELSAISDERDRIVGQRTKLADSIASFWSRLGIALLRLFSRDQPSVAEINREIAKADDRLFMVDQRLDDAETVVRNQRHALRQLEAPLISLKYAIDTSELQRQEAIDETARQTVAIHEAIRQIARTISRAALAGKVLLSTETSDLELASDILALKRILLRKDALQRCIDVATSEADGDLDEAQLSDATAAGRTDQRVPFVGQTTVRGKGTMHEKKTRTVHDTRRNADGSTTPTSRTETYWDKVSIHYDDSVTIRGEIEYCRWRPARAANAIATMVDAGFRQGADRFRQSQIAPAMDALRHQEQEFVNRIASRLMVAENVASG